MKQWREVGETDWIYCQTEAWFEHCKKSPEHDTREVKANRTFAVYTDQFKLKEEI
tara:strand:+ start:390 stop:554 length:165 start_codon:yes stop_codon:yes gene_type:complete